MLELLAVLLLVILGLVLWFEIAMFLDAIRNKRLSENEKILWVIGMLLLHPFIAIVYYFTAHSRIDTK
jgi:hypothetical protein